MKPESLSILKSVAVLLCLNCLTSEAIELGGYYENSLLPQFAEHAEANVQDVSKLRLDFNMRRSGALEFSGDLIFIAYHRAFAYDLRPFLPTAVIDTLDRWQFPAEMAIPESRIFLDNSLITWRVGCMRLRRGRQQLSWGSGYSYNPTDLFHRKDRVEPL